MAESREPGSAEVGEALLAFRDEAASEAATAALYGALRTAKRPDRRGRPGVGGRSGHPARGGRR